MKKRKTVWRWWAKALGEKACKSDKESDRIAGIRTVIFMTYLVTNAFIIAGVIRHWNSNEIPGCILQIEEEQNNKANSSFL